MMRKLDSFLLLFPTFPLPWFVGDLQGDATGGDPGDEERAFFEG
jgi:hypothetical protein